MKKCVKKQIWITKEDDEILKKNAKMACLSEASYLRMLLRGYVPKEKPDIDFYQLMHKIDKFSERLDLFIIKLINTGCYDGEMIQQEICCWHQFQLDVEKRFLAPEEVPWL